MASDDGAPQQRVQLMVYNQQAAHMLNCCARPERREVALRERRVPTPPPPPPVVVAAAASAARRSGPRGYRRGRLPPERQGLRVVKFRVAGRAPEERAAGR